MLFEIGKKIQIYPGLAFILHIQACKYPPKMHFFPE